MFGGGIFVDQQQKISLQRQSSRVFLELQKWSQASIGMEVGGPMTNFIPCLRNFTFVTPLLICHPTEPNRKKPSTSQQYLYLYLNLVQKGIEFYFGQFIIQYQ